MTALVVYLRLYSDCLVQAVRGIAKNLWTLLLPIGLFLVLNLVVAPLVGTLGWLGGLVLGLALDALLSCYLYFLGEVVAHSKVGLGDFKTSIGAYFWSVMNLFFVYWIASLVLGMLTKGSAQASVFDLLLWLAALILLNVAPEVIYQRGTRGGLETAQRSLRFIQENWIEWFVPNLLVLAAYYFALTRLLGQLGALGSALMVVLGALFHLVMVFRGHLFRALDGSSHRQRMFKFRNA